MQHTYVYPEFAYQQSEAQRLGEQRRHRVVIVGAGPIGLTLALDCAQRGLPVLLLDDNNSVSIGSRAVCYAKRTLEIWDRLGVAAPLVEKGVRWQLGKVFFRDELAYSFDLLPLAEQKQPAMINLQQYYLEEQLVAACQAEPLITLAWKHKLLALEQQGDHVLLSVETPDGVFRLEADWLLACDGAGSDTRRMLGADFKGQAFQDRFLIADVVIKTDLAARASADAVSADGEAALQRLGGAPERWFWFDPPFHRGQSVLLHKQCDEVWRIDFQLGWGADPNEERKPERVIPRIQAMLGPDIEFELEWVSVYQFACRRMERFRHGRVLFAGDAAHQVSPFGARGANTGVQDADNLAWKLAAVIRGEAGERLLDSYDEERVFAADDNLLNSTRSTDFITPKSRASLRLRNAVLELARSEPFARPLVNSGRLSTPTPYLRSSLNTADADAFDAPLRPGSPCVDAPLRDAGGHTSWLLDQLGAGFVLLSFGPLAAELPAGLPVPLQVLEIGRDLHDEQGLLAQRYDARPGSCYLIRPDQYLAARWRRYQPEALRAALLRALALQ
ncbi:FAD-dependent oxidoreductase [Paucibacter sp. APW11]|uniref:FAD-dependent oxidoreductase n=1 Tax=Roseateles aquae TaxID=3077235 RepID=A0ABU3PH44_9BURK|nr:FAD-dependent oxidoreductase [Paucibacter sp. APW11]MDT9001432.1 FAD-dependent oxidoreductase [Paucibacter sp. APW11]